MLLLVGLGNPGAQYAKHRHNLGFMVADEIVRRYGLSAARARFHGDVHEGMIAGEKVLVLKPMTMMNDSGRSVGAAVQFYKLAPDEVIVFHDEIDLVPGKVRAKTGGGVAGHNGLRSLDRYIGRDFRRVRIGVGHPGSKDRVSGYVLHDFAKAEWPWVEAIVDAVAQAVPDLIKGDDPGFMNKVALAVQDVVPRKKSTGDKAAKTKAVSPEPGDGDGV